MTNKHRLIAAAIGASVLIGAVAIAQQRPEVTTDKKHPRIVEAQQAVQTAWDKAESASKHYKAAYPGAPRAFVNHLAKARRLLEQANDELRMASEVTLPPPPPRPEPPPGPPRPPPGRP